VKAWRADRGRRPAQAFIPLRFDPGEAYQFDWSHEAIDVHGLPVVVKVAQMRLAATRTAPERSRDLRKLDAELAPVLSY